MSPDDAFGLTLFDRLSCRARIANSVADGLFTPPSERGTLLYPFTGGGANWGGAAYDPMRNLLIVNMNNMAHHIQLIPAERVEQVRRVFHDQEVSPQTGAPFGMKRELLLSPLGLPCTPPPWGVLAAVDLANGEIVWRTALGEVYGAALGLPSLGGPIVTGGRFRVHRRHAHRRHAACLRRGDGRVAVAGATARRRAGHADDVRVGGAAVRGDPGGGQPGCAGAVGGCGDGVWPSLSPAGWVGSADSM